MQDANASSAIAWAAVAAIVAILSFILTLWVTVRSSRQEAISGYMKAHLDAFRLELDADLKTRDEKLSDTFRRRDEGIAAMFDKRAAELDRTFARADLTDMRFKHLEHRQTRVADQLTVLLEAELGRLKNLASDLTRQRDRPQEQES